MDAQAVANMPLHRSGYVPSQQDIRAIRNAANDLPLLEDMINLEMRKLSDLKLAIWKQKALHNALAAPWRRLPPEILSMIFVMALPDSWSRLPALQEDIQLHGCLRHVAQRRAADASAMDIAALR